MSDIIFIGICAVTALGAFLVVSVFLAVCNAIVNFIRKQDIENRRLRKIQMEEK